jgi:glycosyltransferase involved in cell wall biosynthesis
MIDLEQAKQLWPSTYHGRWMSEEYEPGVVSVIIPTYNREQLVIEAMDSVWVQTYRPIELIVVDDGSTDDTSEAVAQWVKGHADDPQFTVRTFSQENRGAPAARNYGLIESHGEFIQFLDSDDLLFSTKLDRQIASIKKNGGDYTYCKVEYRNKHDQVTKHACKPLPSGTGPYLTAHAWKTLSPLFSRKCCLGTGPWDEDLAAGQQYEHAARVKGIGFRGHFDETVLATVRTQESGSIRTQASINVAHANVEGMRKMLRTIKASDLATDADYDNLAASLVVASTEYARLGHRAEAKDCLAEAQRLARRSTLRLQLQGISFAGRLLGLRTIYGGISRVRRAMRRLPRARA